MGALLTTVLLVSLIPEEVRAQGYGYEKASDPLILGVKQAISAARKKQFVEVAKSIQSLKWQIDELRSDVRVDLRATIDTAVASKDVNKIGYALTQLVFQAMRQKFHWNRAEKLESHARARARLAAARFYYEEILSHAMRRADAAQNKKRHASILADFDALRPTIGNPGLFGVGAKKPSVAEFTKLANRIETTLREVYTDFLKSEPPARAKDSKPKGSKPKKAPQEKFGDSGDAKRGDDHREPRVAA